jgi:bacterioferritin
MEGDDAWPLKENSSPMSRIRRRARRDLNAGAVTQNYGGQVEEAIALLNHAVATEIVCVLRYKFHAVCAAGLASEAVKAEFAQHAREEEAHLDMLAERINQLGGRPNLNPDGVGARAASQYVEGENLVDMIKEDLVAERIAIETYRDLVRHFADKDSDDAHPAREDPRAGGRARQRHARPSRQPRRPADARLGPPGRRLGDAPRRSPRASRTIGHAKLRPPCSRAVPRRPSGS